MRTHLVRGAFLALLVGIVGPSTAGPRLRTATFAGGCFWCMTPPFQKVPGVIKVVAGYTDGTGPDPTYEDYGDKGYTEGIQVLFDPRKVSYAKLVDVFWRQINPTDPNGQFVDRGPHYRAAIFYHDAGQRKTAESSRAALDRSGRYDKPIVVPIKPFVNFFPAEEYHQDFYKKDPERYGSYHDHSGRNEYLDKIWGHDNH